jgi:protein ImuB
VSRIAPGRIASVRATPPPAADGKDAGPAVPRLAVVLLSAAPRVAAVGEALCRVDARGWGRRGGDDALARALRAAAVSAGFRDVSVGVADAAVTADAAALVAEAPGVRIVAPGEDRLFLAPLPLSILPLSLELGEALRAAGLRTAGDLATREAEELEARFGREGLRAHRLARGQDERAFRALRPDEPPEASFDLEPAVEGLEPLLFVLRRLLTRVCAELAGEGRCAAVLEIELRDVAGAIRRASVSPARPTRRESLLYDLCRAALERAAAEGRMSTPVEALILRVPRVADPDARQEDLFVASPRDPMAAAAALSRLRARLGEQGVVRPAPRATHRPESRNTWIPVETGSPDTAGARAETPSGRRAVDDPAPCAFRLLPDPVPVRVRLDGDRPVAVEGPGGVRDVEAAEGPERLSGDWWKDPWRREYFRVCTTGGELLWLFREYRRDGAFRWWLHGWWD